MKIIDIIKAEKPSLSFEVFPPKTSEMYDAVTSAATSIATLNPSYMSVTYGAGGGTSQYTVDVAQTLLREGVTPLAHLSCICSTRSNIREQLQKINDAGIENILALRGDIPEGFDKSNLTYHYASDLCREIKSFGNFCIGGACYPEGHPESATCVEDIKALKEKVAAGCEFLTTQMFFDNAVLYNFLFRLRDAGVNVPVVAGIMPVVNPKSIKRICRISGAALPQRFIRIVDKYGNNPMAMYQAGIAYATEQIIDLYANGINAVHIYSMNRPDVAAKIKENVSAIIG